MTDVSASSEESISVALDSSSFLTEKLINRMCFIINSYPFYTDHTHERNSPVIVKKLMAEHAFKMICAYEEHLKICFHSLSDQYQ